MLHLSNAGYILDMGRSCLFLYLCSCVLCSWLCGTEGCVPAGSCLCIVEYLGLGSGWRHLVEGDRLILDLEPTHASFPP